MTAGRPWPRGPAAVHRAPELSSSPAVPRGGSSFCIQLPCPSLVNVEIVVMSDPTICSPTLVYWSKDATLRLVRATNSTGTNSIMSSHGPSQAKVGEAMNANSPTDVSWSGFSDPIFYLLMQAIEVGECFHVQHPYATPSDISYFKRGRGVINGFSGNEPFNVVLIDDRLHHCTIGICLRIRTREELSRTDSVTENHDSPLPETWLNEWTNKRFERLFRTDRCELIHSNESWNPPPLPLQSLLLLVM